MFSPLANLMRLNHPGNSHLQQAACELRLFVWKIMCKEHICVQHLMTSFIIPPLRLIEWQQSEPHTSVTLPALIFHPSLLPLTLKLLVPLSHAVLPSLE
jgi:hypothetical protein